MNIEQIREQLSTYDGSFPQEALLAARAQWGDLYPHLKTLMTEFTQTESLTEPETNLLFLGVHLLADQKEYSAFEPLLALCDKDDMDSALDELLGDAVTSSLPTLFYILSQGQYLPLIKLIKSNKAGVFVKSSAVCALFALYEYKHISYAQLNAELPGIITEFKACKDAFNLTCLATMCLTFGFNEVAHTFNGLVKKGYLDESVTELESIEHWDASTYTDKQNQLNYITNDFDIMSLKSWASYTHPNEAPYSPHLDDEYLSLLDENMPLVVGAKIGRNDPCPCGSGKKYKKCCL